VFCLRNGTQFKSGRADQLRISPTMSWQLTPPSCTMIVQRPGNRRGYRKGSWGWGRLDETLRHANKWRFGPDPKGASPKEPGTSGRPRSSRQLDQSWSRYVLRRPAAFHRT
jgi:hypothetical protein